ncbi:hypothetical protein ACEQ8H_002199 [Pleosporales sp. CAS-2024a]
MTPNIPSSCRAVVIEKPNAPWAIKEVPVSAPKHGHVLIKVHACGICHSDSFLQQGAFGGLASFPRIPGHDGVCKACNRGLFRMCEKGVENGVTRDGGYAEYCTLRSEAAVRIPQDADPAEYAPLLCAGVTVFNGIRNMNIVPGDTVAVQGLGGLGHLAVQYARKLGYRTIALSTSSDKKEFAKQLGANEYIDTSKEDAGEALQKMGGASLIVVTAPNPDMINPLVNGLGPLGKLLMLAPVGDVQVNTVSLISRGASLHGWPSGAALDCEETIAFAEHQGVKCMVEKFPFDKVEDAVKHMESGKVRFRSVIVMD